uniref:Cytochrome b5 heme-binding domain-containing protein n=1 Tax=Strongyloides venezuelensis TaxID=75913 RepID=A0A0K0FYQ5_STRVS
MGPSENVKEQGIKYFTRNEVADHSSVDDIWMIIHDNIYDLTSFLDLHPGGMDILLEYAGMDATLYFENKGHSIQAWKMLEPYKIGKLLLDRHSECINTTDKSFGISMLGVVAK